MGDCAFTPAGMTISPGCSSRNDEVDFPRANGKRSHPKTAKAAASLEPAGAGPMTSGGDVIGRCHSFRSYSFCIWVAIHMTVILNSSS
jgi:hypothetical protein